MAGLTVPGESREDRAKRVAKSYRQLVVDLAQHRYLDPAHELARLDQRWAAEDVHWQIPGGADLLSDPEEWLSAPDLAHALGRTRKDIYNWARRGQIEQRVGADGGPEYLIGSVIAYQARLFARRAQAASD
jgi:hypothetical protein